MVRDQARVKYGTDDERAMGWYIVVKKSAVRLDSNNVLCIRPSFQQLFHYHQPNPFLVDHHHKTRSRPITHPAKLSDLAPRPIFASQRYVTVYPH